MDKQRRSGADGGKRHTEKPTRAIDVGIETMIDGKQLWQVAE